MRLERHVAEILQGHDAVGVGVSENRRHRQRDLPQEAFDVGERQRPKLDGTGVHRQHDGATLGEDCAKVPPIRRIAGQGNNSRPQRQEPGVPQVALDAVQQFAFPVRGLVCHLIHRKRHPD